MGHLRRNRLRLCEGVSQTPLATEKLQRQMVSVFAGTEQGDAS